MQSQPTPLVNGGRRLDLVAAQGTTTTASSSPLQAAPLLRSTES